MPWFDTTKLRKFSIVIRDTRYDEEGKLNPTSDHLLIRAKDIDDMERQVVEKACEKFTDENADIEYSWFEIK